MSVGAYVSKQRAPHSAQRSRGRKRLGSWRAEGMRARGAFTWRRGSARLWKRAMQGVGGENGGRTSVASYVEPRQSRRNFRLLGPAYYSTSARGRGGTQTREMGKCTSERSNRRLSVEERSRRKSTSQQSSKAEWWRLCSEGVADRKCSVVKQEAAVAIPNETANRCEIRA